VVKAFSIQGDVAVDTTQVHASLKQIEGTQTRARVGIDDRDAKRQAQGMLTLIQRVGRTTTTPRVDATNVIRAQTEVTKLDKMLRQVDTTQRTTGGAARAGRAAAGAGAMGGLGGLGGLGMGMGMGGFAMAGAGVLGGVGLMRGFKTAIDKGAEQVRMEETVARIFGGAGNSMVAYANDLSRATGYHTSDILQAQASMADMAEAMGGISPAQINQLMEAVTGIAHATGLPQYRDDVQAVTEAIGRGVQGMGRGLKMLGINVDETYMRTVYMNGALRDSWKEMDQASRQQHSLNAILQQTSDVAKAASEDTDSYAYSMRQWQKTMNDVAENLGMALMKVVGPMAKLAAAVPSGVFEGLMYAGLAGLAVRGGAGLFRAGRGLAGGIRGLVTRTAVAGGAEVAATAAATKAATTAATKAAATAATATATTAATTAGAQAAGALGGSLIARSVASGLAAVGGLPGIVMAAGAAMIGYGIGKMISNEMYKPVDAAYEQTAENETKANLRNRWNQQKAHGIDWGVYRDETGKLVQGDIIGWDKKAGAAYRTQTIVDAEGRPRTGYLAGTLRDVNRYGQGIGTPYFGQYARPQGINITLDNRSGVPLQATDVQSSAPSNY
jgi:hypothetical protein